MDTTLYNKSKRCGLVITPTAARLTVLNGGYNHSFTLDY